MRCLPLCTVVASRGLGGMVRCGGAAYQTGQDVGWCVGSLVYVWFWRTRERATSISRVVPKLEGHGDIQLLFWRTEKLAYVCSALAPGFVTVGGSGKYLFWGGGMLGAGRFRRVVVLTSFIHFPPFKTRCRREAEASVLHCCGGTSGKHNFDDLVGNRDLHPVTVAFDGRKKSRVVVILFFFSFFFPLLFLSLAPLAHTLHYD